MKLSVAVFAFTLSVAASSAPGATPSAALASIAPKSYAVFMATFNPSTGETTGGVAGSAFFISPTQAITAFHVLQPASFNNSNTQIWLVHENEKAIELSRENLTSIASRDRTSINLNAARAPARHIYAQANASELAAGAKVETDGFLANSTGPVLEMNQSSSVPSSSSSNGRHPRLAITDVPHLERLHSEGTLLRNVRIELSSSDVNLTNAPCVEVSYKPIVGLSGGPLVSNGRVIGMNSFAEPNTRESTFAVDLSQN